MLSNLEQLQRDILADLEERGLVTFRSYARGPELGADAVYWDNETYPNYRDFLAAAEAAGARLVTVSTRRLTEEVLEDALDHLASTRLDREERRQMETRLKEMRRWVGYLCQLELSFSLDRRTYIFDQPTDWYDELSELLEQIEDSFGSSHDERPLGGFYSNN